MNEACLTSWLLNQGPVYWAAVDTSRRCPTHHFSLVLHLSPLGGYSHGEGGGNGHSRRSSPPPAFYLLLDLSVLLLRYPGHPLISQRIIQTRRKPQPTRVCLHRPMQPLPCSWLQKQGCAFPWPFPHKLATLGSEFTHYQFNCLDRNKM